MLKCRLWCPEAGGPPASAPGPIVSTRCGNGALPRPFAAVPVRGPRSLGFLAKPGAAQDFLICSRAFVQSPLSYYTKSCSLDWS